MVCRPVLLVVVWMFALLCGHLQAATAVWEVSKGKTRFLLGASLSVLQQKHYPLPREFTAAFNQADLVVVERDLAQVTAPEFSTQLMEKMLYTDGTNLKSQLRPPVYEQLQQFSQSRGVPLFGLAMFKPAFVLASLTAHETARADFVYGVDAHFFYSAQEQKKRLRTLETSAQQLELLDALNQEDPNQLMLSMMAELNLLKTTLQQAEPLWRQGKMTGLDALFGAKMRKMTPRAYQTLVVKRHPHWLVQLDALAGTSQRAFVLLDVLHMSGPDSILVALERRGYKITPFIPKS
jgi:uncharacterized protein